MKKMNLSLYKAHKFNRYLQIDYSDSSESEEYEEPVDDESKQISEESFPTEPINTEKVTTKVIQPGNITETLDDIQDNRESSVHFKKLYGYRSTKIDNSVDPEKPILLEFYLLIQYINLEPYELVSFSLRIYKNL